MQGGDFLPNQGLDAGALNFGTAFLTEIQRSADLADVERLLEAAARELGFRHYAMIHHDDHRAASPGLINMNNYPADYAAAYFGGLYHRDDPVVHACIAANACFAWCELADLIELAPRHHHFLERGARHGVTHGITVPAFVLGERSGSCNFCSPRTPDLTHRHLAAAQMVGGFAFQKARRIVGRHPRPIRTPGLQPRQRECAILAAQGKSNTDIATIPESRDDQNLYRSRLRPLRGPQPHATRHRRHPRWRNRPPRNLPASIPPPGDLEILFRM